MQNRCPTLFATLFVLTWSVAGADCRDKDANNAELADLNFDVELFTVIEQCPVKDGRIRAPDAVAPNGGGAFYAQRGGNAKKCHFGLDLEINATAPKTGFGEKVYAVSKGKVLVAGTEADGWKGFGNVLIIDHGNNYYGIYAHLNEMKVKRGDSVTAGQVIGTIGYSGNASALQGKNLPPHLHFGFVRSINGFNGTGPINSFRAQNAAGDGMPSMKDYGFINATGNLSVMGCL